MEKTPSWEVNRSSNSQEFPRILWKPDVHYLTHKSPPPVLIPSPIDPVHASMSQFWEVHFNITLPSTPGLPSGLFPSGFPTKNLYAPLLSPICVTFPAYLILLYLITQNYLLRSTEHKTPLFVVFSTSFYLIPLRSRYLPQHSILEKFWPMLLPQCDRPNFTTTQNNNKNFSSVYLIFIFLDSKPENKMFCTEW